MSTQQSLRPRRAHQAHRRRRSSSASCSRRPGTVSARSPSDLASLRFFVLSHIEEIERKLQSLDSSNARCSPSAQDQDETSGPESPCRSPPPEEADIHPSGLYLSDGSIPATSLDAIVQEGLKRLQHLRDEVSARLPDLEELKSNFPDFDWELPNVSLVDFRARMPDMPNLSDVRSKLPDLDEYLPTLSERLRSLQSYLSNVPSISSAVNLSPLHDLLDTLLSSELIEDVQAEAKRAQTQAERTAAQVMSALKKSLHGQKLISYHDLPKKWRNNEWVHGGYRFIPLQEWPSLVLSIFTLHNETINIHTHLIPLTLFAPFLLYGWGRYTDVDELPTTLFSVFASGCLFSSVIWHTCAGSAHEPLMEFTARVDYVGIGWLISASIATVCWYGFSCRPFALIVYLSTNLACGIAGSVLPFMQWFNSRKHKKWRVVFFLSLAFTGLAPLGHLSLAHSFLDMWRFLRPIVPSLLSYIIGLVFYATHFPECYLSFAPRAHSTHHHHKRTDSTDSFSSEVEFDHPDHPVIDHSRHAHSKWRWIDYIGGGSHALWHILIIIAILSHRAGLPELRAGPAGERCDALREMGWIV